MMFEVYCDGSATTGDKPGGFAFVLCCDGVKIGEGSGHLTKATNNVAEITAAIRGLDAVSKTREFQLYITENAGKLPATTLVSDSQLTLKYANGEYQCRKYHLLQLYLELRRHYQKIGATTRWVKGHSGDEHNERCDELAKAARANPNIQTQISQVSASSTEVVGEAISEQ